MPLKTIGDRILADADIEAERLRARSEKTATQIVQDSRAEADSLIKGAVEQAQRKGTQKKKQKLAAASLAARDRVVAAKQAAIDEAFSRAKELIDHKSESQYIDMLAGLMAAHARGAEEVIFDAADKKIAKKAVDKANIALKSSGREPVVLADKTRPIGKGFILSSGKIEESCALSALLKSARDEHEAEVARIIFGENI